AAGRRAAPQAQAGEPRGARPAGRPADDEGRGRRPDPPAAGDGGQAGGRGRRPQHRGEPDPRHAGRLTPSATVRRPPAGAGETGLVTGVFRATPRYPLGWWRGTTGYV